MAVEELDIVGAWPELAGKTLDQLIAQESWFEGERDDEANVVWLQAGGQWHRLYFDSDAVFWGTHPSGPKNDADDAEEKPDFPLADLAAAHKVAGQTITACDGDWVDDTSLVTLRFQNGTAITFRNKFDTTTVLLNHDTAP